MCDGGIYSDKVIITQEASKPSVAVTPSNVSVSAVGGEGTFAVTLRKIDLSNVSDVSIVPYDENGNVIPEEDSPDRIRLELSEDRHTVNYIVEPNNDNGARTAYFKVLYIVFAVDVFSNMVAVTQASNVASEPFTLSVSEKAGDGEAYYATVSNLGDGNFIVPEGIEASTIVIDNRKIQKTFTYVAGEVMPGCDAYLIESTTFGSFDFYPTDAQATSEFAENWLYPATAGVEITAPDDSREYKFYQLSLNASHKPGTVGFYYGPQSISGGPFTFTSAHKAYLAVPQDEQATGSSIGLFDEDITVVGSINSGGNGHSGVYTISGVEVDGRQLPKGIYVAGGKKQVVK